MAVETVYTCDIIQDEKTGDQILQFPDKMMEELDWRINDELSFELTPDGIVITNLSWQKRKEK